MNDEVWKPDCSKQTSLNCGGGRCEMVNISYEGTSVMLAPCGVMKVEVLT